MTARARPQQWMQTMPKISTNGTTKQSAVIIPFPIRPIEQDRNVIEERYALRLQVIYELWITPSRVATMYLIGAMAIVFRFIRQVGQIDKI